MFWNRKKIWFEVSYVHEPRCSEFHCCQAVVRVCIPRYSRGWGQPGEIIPELVSNKSIAGEVLCPHWGTEVDNSYSEGRCYRYNESKFSSSTFEKTKVQVEVFIEETTYLAEEVYKEYNSLKIPKNSEVHKYISPSFLSKIKLPGVVQTGRWFIVASTGAAKTVVFCQYVYDWRISAVFTMLSMLGLFLHDLVMGEYEK